MHYVANEADECHERERQAATIAIVDDSPENIEFLACRLTSSGHRTILYEDGEKALKGIQRERPDLVLLDIMLPGMNGFEVCRRLKAGEGTHEIPVIFMTALTNSENEIMGFEAGAVDYIMKPIHLDTALARIRTHLSLRSLQQRVKSQNQQLQQEIAMRKKQEREYRLVVENSYDIVYQILPDGTIGFISSQIRRYGFNPDELQGKHFIELILPEDREQVLQDMQATLVSGAAVQTLFRVRAASGDVYCFEEIGSPFYDESGNILGITGVVRDVTERTQFDAERRRFEQQLSQKQRLESLGTLAAGIAHDFNNNLGSILGYTEYLLAKQPEDAEDKTFLERIYRSGERAAELVRQILIFSKARRQQLTAIDLSAAIEETLELLQATIPATIDIRTSIQTGCSPVPADVSQISQLLVNLCTNACHAMQEGGGILSITLEESADGLILTVGDTGKGMAPEIQEHVFEPFFTTKAVDEGTGLGLSLVHGIVEGHHGEISIESKVGQGTQVRIVFPVTEQSAGPETVPEPALHHSHQGSLLIVDDEAALTRLYETVLRQSGYQVTVRHNGQDALELFRQDPERFDLVFSDQTMPGLLGTQLSRELIRIRADLPIILSSGYSEKISRENAVTFGVRHFIMKPVRLRELLQLIQHTLGGGHTRHAG